MAASKGRNVELDPEVVQAIGRRAKRAIRARMRSLRQALPPSAHASRSALVCESVLASPEYTSARSLALFAPLGSEVAIAPIDAAARAQGRKVYYPFMDPKPGGYTTGFRLVDELGSLVDRGRGFLEPPEQLPAARRGDIDLVVVPALAVSGRGQRLGYGSGFYDATLPDVCPPAHALAIAFDFQLIGELPSEDHDVLVHTIVTDKRVLRPSPG
jgi:5-formyltetrahydrofolate cyclo-ligase